MFGSLLGHDKKPSNKAMTNFFKKETSKRLTTTSVVIHTRRVTQYIEGHDDLSGLDQPR